MSEGRETILQKPDTNITPDSKKHNFKLQKFRTLQLCSTPNSEIDNIVMAEDRETFPKGYIAIPQKHDNNIIPDFLKDNFKLQKFRRLQLCTTPNSEIDNIVMAED